MFAHSISKYEIEALYRTTPTPLHNYPKKAMEVHHHPEVEKKGFKEYVLEGLMIFLAVLMGFIAENIRESITEHNRAKEYAETMVADLKADTANLNIYLTYYTFATNQTDTLMQLLSTSEIKNITGGKLYWYGLGGGAKAAFVPNDATFQQMKSSGSLRFFKKTIAREVATYDQLCRKSIRDQEADQLLWADLRSIKGQIFEFQYNKEANDMITYSHPDKRNFVKIAAFCKQDLPLLTYDKAIFNQYLELIRARFLSYKVIDGKKILKSATKLIADIKKEYHIED